MGRFLQRSSRGRFCQSPHIRFMHCTADPAAPLPRLSMARDQRRAPGARDRIPSRRRRNSSRPADAAPGGGAGRFSRGRCGQKARSAMPRGSAPTDLARCRSRGQRHIHRRRHAAHHLDAGHGQPHVIIAARREILAHFGFVAVADQRKGPHHAAAHRVMAGLAGRVARLRCCRLSDPRRSADRRGSSPALAPAAHSASVIAVALQPTPLA